MWGKNMRKLIVVRQLIISYEKFEMRCLFFLSLIAVFTFPACKNINSDSSHRVITKKIIKKEIQAPAIPHLDTTISVRAISDINGSSMTEGEAKAFLYKYFRRKEVVNRDNFTVSSLHFAGKMCVDYDTVYKIQCPKFSGSIISYWLGPCDLNGHCFQPSKAIIVKTKNGYKISDVDFIPTNFAIDSTKYSFIYGHEYDCGGRGLIRHFRIKLE
jgi:hypothetical protein